MKTLINLARRSYELLLAGSAALQSPFLLALRLYFFWQLFLTGKGKLSNIGKVSEILHEPWYPVAHAERVLYRIARMFRQFAADHRSRIAAPSVSDRDLDERCLPRCRF